MSLTGKQKKFVAEYLNGCNFNATAAAAAAGYRATTRHSFEAIGSENLTRPAIKAAIDEYFAGAEVGAEETLRELSKLARGNSKDKIRALALLSQHHGLLDGTWASRPTDSVIEIKVQNVVQQRLDELTDGLEQDIAESDREKTEQWNAVIRKYSHSPIAVEALRFLRAVMEGKENVADDVNKQAEPKPEPLEVEIIPPSRRLQPAPIERMMAKVITPEIVESEPLANQPSRCNHSNKPHYHDWSCRLLS